MDEEIPMKPEKNNDAEDKPPVLKEEAIALAEPAPPVVDVAKKRRNTNFGVGIGVLLQVAGIFVGQSGSGAAILGMPLILLSFPPFIWGCSNYAEAKGYSKEVGVVGYHRADSSDALAGQIYYLFASTEEAEEGGVDCIDAWYCPYRVWIWVAFLGTFFARAEDII